MSETKAVIVDEKSFLEYSSKKILFCGNGALKCESALSNLNADFNGDSYPSAEFMIKLAHEKFKSKDFADLVYFEPFYLKSFIATTPKKLL